MLALTTFHNLKYLAFVRLCVDGERNPAVGPQEFVTSEAGVGVTVVGSVAVVSVAVGSAVSAAARNIRAERSVLPEVLSVSSSGSVSGSGSGSVTWLKSSAPRLAKVMLFTWEGSPIAVHRPPFLRFTSMVARFSGDKLFLR